MYSGWRGMELAHDIDGYFFSKEQEETNKGWIYDLGKELLSDIFWHIWQDRTYLRTSSTIPDQKNWNLIRAKGLARPIWPANIDSCPVCKISCLNFKGTTNYFKRPNSRSNVFEKNVILYVELPSTILCFYANCSRGTLKTFLQRRIKLLYIRKGEIRISKGKVCCKISLSLNITLFLYWKLAVRCCIWLTNIFQSGKNNCCGCSTFSFISFIYFRDCFRNIICVLFVCWKRYVVGVIIVLDCPCCSSCSSCNSFRYCRFSLLAATTFAASIC